MEYRYYNLWSQKSERGQRLWCSQQKHVTLAKWESRMQQMETTQKQQFCKFRHCGSVHRLRQCPAYSKACSRCNVGNGTISKCVPMCPETEWKKSNYKQIRAVGEIQQNKEFGRERSKMLPEVDSSMDMLITKSLSFNSIRSIIVTKLAISNKNKRYIKQHKLDAGSGGNLPPMGLVKSFLWCNR